ncbi:hypothetical protein DIPPA_05605 [Diplonema papillatum]|nr:hypothetical protein DIPPA_05605 [Diplonema papillatum]
MRATGSVFDYAGIDRVTQSCLATITGIETDDASWTQASLPVRMGGLGLHSCADVSGIAHIAAALDGGPHLPPSWPRPCCHTSVVLRRPAPCNL